MPVISPDETHAGVANLAMMSNSVTNKFLPQDSLLKPSESQYSGPPLIRTPLLPNNSVLIREVSFGEREHYIHL